MIKTKVCSKCGIEKSLSEFHKNNRNKLGVDSRCKQCKSEYARKRQRELNPNYKPRIKENLPLNKKRCSKCGEIKDLTEYHVNKTKKDGIESACKVCSLKQKKEYAERNKERLKAYKAEYRKKNKEKIRQALKEYYGQNKELIKSRSKKRYEENKNELLQKFKEYAEKNEPKLKRYIKKYYEKNKKEITRYKKEYAQRNSLYENYAHLLTSDEAPIADEHGYLFVKCAYCGRYFNPMQSEVLSRIASLKGTTGGENRLYCTDRCKTACPIFKKIKYPRGHQTATSREVQPELRQMRLACDEYSCQICGKTIDEAQLHCHHIEGVEQNPIESADLDNTITLCKKCHKWAHTQEGCRYFELRCNQ
jgi:5-methylcytosine-specific restriction endonuclease McrA